jgi:hypothetical protein
MWSAIRWLLLRIAAIRWVFKLGWLGLLIPIAFVLKSIGLPLLIILCILALPILLMMFVFGLPIFLVVMAGGAFMGLVSVVLSLSFAVLKIALMVVLPIWLVFAIAPRIRRRALGISTQPELPVDGWTGGPVDRWTATTNCVGFLGVAICSA